MRMFFVILNSDHGEIYRRKLRSTCRRLVIWLVVLEAGQWWNCFWLTPAWDVRDRCVANVSAFSDRPLGLGLPWDSCNDQQLLYSLCFFPLWKSGKWPWKVFHWTDGHRPVSWASDAIVEIITTVIAWNSYQWSRHRGSVARRHFRLFPQSLS